MSNEIKLDCVSQVVEFLEVEPTHPGSSLRLDMGARIFFGFIPRFSGTIHSVVSDVPVYSETSVVTSLILRFAGPTQFFKGAHSSRVCVRAFIGVIARSLNHYFGMIDYLDCQTDMNGLN